MNFLRIGRSLSFYFFIKKVIKHTLMIIEECHFCHWHSRFYPPSCCQG